MMLDNKLSKLSYFGLLSENDIQSIIELCFPHAPAVVEEDSSLMLHSRSSERKEVSW